MILINQARTALYFMNTITSIFYVDELLSKNSPGTIEFTYDWVVYTQFAGYNYEKCEVKGIRLGVYSSEQRCKQIIEEIAELYCGSYFPKTLPFDPPERYYMPGD